MISDTPYDHCRFLLYHPTEHVNLAILDNTMSHIHVHLIPRFPQNEANPQLSPWGDPRPKTLMLDDKKRIVKSIRYQLQRQKRE